jgi:hypothetical protein
MPKAILAIRSYPQTLLLAALMFALTLILTATSVGKVGAGGDDEGSGLGGTGRTGDSGGSGFGGTGSPSPFLGLSEEDEGEKARQELDRMREELRPVDVPEALQRSIESNLLRESSRIAETASPAIEVPTLTPVQDSVDTERLLRSDVAPAMQIARPTIQMPAPVTLPESGNTIESFQLPLVEGIVEIIQPELAQQEPTETDGLKQDANRELSSELSAGLETDQPEVFKQEAVKEEVQLAEGEAIQQDSEPAVTDDDRRVAPDRIPRPELPPFQRVRPAVDRISISAPRPQPMRI